MVAGSKAPRRPLPWAGAWCFVLWFAIPAACAGQGASLPVAGGLSALPHFAYFDAQGQAHKAFVLPQKDPARYDTFLDTYNVLELVKSRVTITPSELASGMQSEAEDAVFPNPPEVDAYTGATPR